jgi:hypothetical protein
MMAGFAALLLIDKTPLGSVLALVEAEKDDEVGREDT